MSDIETFATGLLHGITNYMGKQQDTQNNVSEYAQKKAIDQQYADKGDESDPVLSPDMAEKVLPGFGANMVNQYNQQNPNKPLKLKDGVSYLKTAADALSPDEPKASPKHYMGNDPEGNAIFADNNGKMFSPDGSIYMGKVLPKSSTMPTSSTRSSAEFATTILPHIQEMRQLVNEADQKGFIGPTSGRIYNQFMAGKVGSTGNPEADELLGKMRAMDSLLKTGAMRVHFGARGGANMYDHFSDLLNSGKQSKAMLNGSLDTLENFMQGYSNAGIVSNNKPSKQTEDNNDPLGIR